MSQSSVSQTEAREATVRPIGIVAFDGVEILDLTGPMDVFNFANAGLRRAGVAKEAVYPARILAKKPGLVTTACGLQIGAESAYGDILDGIDTLLIPGSPDVESLLSDPLLQDWIRAISPRCGGSFRSVRGLFCS